MFDQNLQSRVGRRCCTLVFLLMLLLLLEGGVLGASHLILPAAQPEGSFSSSYFRALQTGAQDAQKLLPAMAKAGDAVAEKLLAGGELFIAGTRFDFVSEGMGRSGGLMMLREYSAEARLGARDAVIYSWSNLTPAEDLAMARRLRDSGAFVIGIGPRPAAELVSALSVFLESLTPLPEDVLRRLQGQPYALHSQQNLALMWALTGEIVSALTRRGRMPAMFQSVLVPGARERNLAYRGQKFHPEHEVPALEAGRLGGDFLNTLAGLYRDLAEEETGSIQRAARAGMEVRREGHQVHAWLISHYPHWQPGAPGDPQFIRPFERIAGEVPQIEELEAHLKPGDLFLFLGYYRRPVEVYEAARLAGAKIIEVISGMGQPETALPEPDFIIDPKWPFGDALVEVPHYDVKILPSSGIIQASIWWALVGSMAAEDQKVDDVIHSMKFARLQPGAYRSRPEGEQSREVTISRPFEMQATEVTQAQWEAVMGRNPSEFTGDGNLPVENVTWNDAREFINRLNSRQKTYLYRLPTEEEWEYACRAGQEGNQEDLSSTAWYLHNSGKKTHPVAQKQPNGWGLYDMLGNVWEWNQEDAEMSITEPKLAPSGTPQVVRGCGWGGAPVICSCSFRDALAPIRRDGALGFRLVRVNR